MYRPPLSSNAAKQVVLGALLFSFLSDGWFCAVPAQVPEGTIPLTEQDVSDLRAIHHRRAQVAGTRGNMRTIQIAVEEYCTDSGGVYPASFTAAMPYLTGGSRKIGGTPGTLPTNYITGVTEQPVFNANIKSRVQMAAMRKIPPQLSGGKPGQVGYSMFDNGQNYAIIGTDVDGNAIPRQSDGHTLVLSNDDPSLQK